MLRHSSARAHTRHASPWVAPIALPVVLLLAACSRPPAARAPSPASVAAPPSSAAPPREEAPKGALELTYLGVAGWQIEGAGRTVLVDRL